MQCGKIHARAGCFMTMLKASMRRGSSARWSRAATSCLSFAIAFVPASARTEPIETEHLFGFTIGSDVGDVGEREIEGSATGRFAKQAGTYDATSSTISAEFV